MSKAEKTFEKVMSGRSDANVSFEDACNLLLRLGYAFRQQGASHHIFSLGDSYLNLMASSPPRPRDWPMPEPASSG